MCLCEVDPVKIGNRLADIHRNSGVLGLIYSSLDSFVASHFVFIVDVESNCVESLVGGAFLSFALVLYNYASKNRLLSCFGLSRISPRHL